MNNICFYHEKRQVSFSEFAQDINIARTLCALSPSKNVILFHEDSYKFSVLLFALILENKHVFLPPNKQSGTIEKLADLCDATAGDILIANKAQITITTLTQHVSKKTIDLTPEQLFSLFTGKVTFFTSGSTGQPKAITKTCRQLTCELKTLSSTFSQLLSVTKIFISTVSHQHIYGLLYKILLPLRLGKVIVCKHFEYPEHINVELSEFIFDQAKLNDKSITLISSPAHLKRLVLDNVLSPYASFYGITFSSGGLLAQETSQTFAKQMGNAPIEVFGSTETGGIAWRNEQATADAPWYVFPGISYQVSQSTMCLEIFSPIVDQQPYLTEDMVESVDTKRFILKGRVDRTVKIEEKRVNLDHIEQCLTTHHWVSEAKVFIITSHTKAAQRKTLCCVLVIKQQAEDFLVKSGKRALNEKLKSHLLNDFERICLPKKWRYLDKFPYNSQGKLVLSDLERLFD